MHVILRFGWPFGFYVKMPNYSILICFDHDQCKDSIELPETKYFYIHFFDRKFKKYLLAVFKHDENNQANVLK